MFFNKAGFYGEELSTSCPTPKLEDYPLLAVCECLFIIFTATLYIGGCSFVHKLRTRHAVVMDPLITGSVQYRVRNMEDIHSFFYYGTC
jgi:hypothetical protein